ncbi:MAG TPA: nuclease-related domain-containing protein [Microthrixaceae bacterium]|nr:nuclease-related domain-containing protein [Microthrixaceae bacterium]
MEDREGSPAEGWWIASDGHWYPPELHPDRSVGSVAADLSGADVLASRAGSSAEAEADRLRKLADQQQARAEQTRIQADNWAKGAEGERRTAAVLDALPATFAVLHDLHVPGSKANVDHLVIGPNGVFAVDSKAHSGVLTAGSDTLWRGRFPIRKEADTLSFIAGRISEHLDVPVIGVLCFTEAELPQPVNDLGLVRAVSLDALVATVTAGPTTNSPEMVAWLTRLASELEVPTKRAATDAPAASSATARSRPTRTRSRPTRTSAAPKGKPQRAQGSGARSTGPRQRGAKKGGCAPIVGGVIALLFIWWFLAVGLQQMVKSASLTTTTVASPAVGITFSCPAPGAGYTGTFTYPTEGSNFASYDIVVTFGTQELYRDRWSNKYIGPPTMTGLWPAVELTVTTASTTNASSASTQTVVTPAAPC